MRLFLFFIFIFSVTISYAQFGVKGQKVLGGAVSFNTGQSMTSNNPGIKPTSNSLFASISLGKFTKHNTQNIISFSYGHGYVKNPSQNNISRNFTNSVFLSYGITKYTRLAQKMFFGINGSVYGGYNNVKNYNTALPDVGKSDGLSLGIYVVPTFTYQLTNRLIISFGGSKDFLNLNYNNSKVKTYIPNQPTIISKTQNFNLNAGFGSSLSDLNVGFSYLLKNKLLKN